MADFTSGFWSIYITVLTILSVIGCAWLLWSQASFKAQGMPEVICESRHATFGPLAPVESRLVRCQPPEANAPIKNVDQVKGNIVYIKRGGCSFTKKARMAQAAGAVAMVVANTDRETFGRAFCSSCAIVCARVYV